MSELVFTIEAWPIDLPYLSRFWRAKVTCPHGLVYYTRGEHKSERAALRAATTLRGEVRGWCSDAACGAYHARADAPSETQP